MRNLYAILMSALVLGAAVACGGTDDGGGGGTPSEGEGEGASEGEGEGASEGEGEGDWRDCEDECAGGERRCDGSGAYKECMDHDYDFCTEWGAPVPCEATEVCRGDRCEPKQPGDPCDGHDECPGEQVCAGGFCDQMHGRDYLVGVREVRVRNRPDYDVDGSAPDIWIVVKAGPNAHEQGGDGEVVGSTEGAAVENVLEATWVPQDWRFRLEVGTGFRVEVYDADWGTDDWLGAILSSPAFIAQSIKSGEWAFDEVNPDYDIQRMRGEIRPVE